jgi:hypothetical protein
MDCDLSIQVEWTIGNRKIHPGQYLIPGETDATSRIVLRRAADGNRSPAAAAQPGDHECLFSVLIVDPDAPLDLDQIIHGAVFNCHLDCDIFAAAHGELIVRHYRGAGPPARSGRHRYVAFAFAQPRAFTHTELHSAVPHVGFDVSRFADRWGLGAPVGINLFLSEYDGGCWLACLSALLCRCCCTAPPRDWYERAEAKLLQR